jgi:hypothetical protein
VQSSPISPRLRACWLSGDRFFLFDLSLAWRSGCGSTPISLAGIRQGPPALNLVWLFVSPVRACTAADGVFQPAEHNCCLFVGWSMRLPIYQSMLFSGGYSLCRSNGYPLFGWWRCSRALSKNEGLVSHCGDALISNRSVLVGEISSIRRLVPAYKRVHDAGDGAGHRHRASNTGPSTCRSRAFCSRRLRDFG